MIASGLWVVVARLPLHRASVHMHCGSVYGTVAAWSGYAGPLMHIFFFKETFHHYNAKITRNSAMAAEC